MSHALATTQTTDGAVRRTTRIVLAALTCVSLAAALGTGAVWLRSIWIANWVGSESLTRTPQGGDYHANTVLYTLPGGLLIFKQVNDGPRTFTIPIDPHWKWYSDSNGSVALRDLWFRVSFTRYSHPPRFGETIGDRGYTLELGIPDWALIGVFLIIPAWRLWRRRGASRRRIRGFELVGFSQEPANQSRKEPENGCTNRREPEASGWLCSPPLGATISR